MSASETATQSQVTEPEKKYKTEAEGVLLALSGQPRILDLDDVWKQDARSVKSKDFRVEDLITMMIYYTHGAEGIRKLQTQRPETDKLLLYKAKMREDPDEKDSMKKTIEVYAIQDGVRIVVSEEPTNPEDRAFCCEMCPDFKILAGGCEKQLVATFVAMSLMDMIVSIRGIDSGEFEDEYFAKLYERALGADHDYGKSKSQAGTSSLEFTCTLHFTRQSAHVRYK